MRSSRGILIALALGLVLVFGVVAFLIFSPPPHENALPTLIVMNTDAPTETPSPTLEASPTATASESPSPEPSEEASPTDTPSQTESFVQASNTPAPSATPAASTTSQTSAIQPNAATATTGSGGVIVVSTLVPSLTPTATNTLRPGETPAPPTATLDATGLVLFNQPQEIGVGTLRVLSMTAPADEVILSLGGTLPTIQPNQQWVLVELFLICPGTSNCAPPASSFSLQSTANRYTPTPLNIESAFGSLVLGNQVLGHIAYVIPRSESPFALELNLNGQVHRFALQ